MSFASIWLGCAATPRKDLETQWSAFWISSGVAEVSFGGGEYATSDLGEQYFFEKDIRIAHESLYMIYLKLFDFPGLFQM